MSPHHQVRDVKNESNQDARLTPEEPSSSEAEQTKLPSDVQEPLVKIHQHLVDVSYLVRKCYDELIKHQSGYEQAYLSEQHKLAQNVAAYKVLAIENERLGHENRYCKQQLLPEYDRLLHRQTQEIREMQERVRSVELANLAHEKGNYEKEEEHRRTMDAMVERFRAQDDKIEGLEKRNKELSDLNHHSPDLHRPPITRATRQSSKRENEVSMQEPTEPTKKSRKRRQG